MVLLYEVYLLLLLILDLIVSAETPSHPFDVLGKTSNSLDII